MVLEIIDNNELLMNGTEQELFSAQTGLAHYSTKVFFDELAAGDEIVIRVYDEDLFDDTERKYRTVIVEGLQDNPEQLINWIPSTAYRVTLEQTSGTFRTISWALYSS